MMSQSNGEDVLRELARVLDGRKGGDPDLSYVSRLFHKGQDAILKKVGEEATELVMASKDGVADKVIAETADLWFHCMVLLSFHGLEPAHVLAELQRRVGMSGLEEKASRKAIAREHEEKGKTL
jgi:phosphoribosyl-ATP pyrophosphohydrolase